MNSVTLICLAFTAIVGASISEAADCSSKFKLDSKHANASEECVKKLTINPEDMPPSEEEFVKTFDDKCFGKCFMTGMGFLKDLKFDKDAIKADIKEHVIDETVQKRVLDYTLKCIEELDAAIKTAGGKVTEANQCKLSAQFLYCTVKKEEKLEC